jgi:sarcosine oxidase gamma subunit
MAELICTTSGHPGYRQLTGITAVTVRHFAGDNSAHDAVLAQGMAWSDTAGMLTGQDPYLAWRSPQERIALGQQAQPLHALLASLAPGRSDTAVALDVSEALTVFELQGARLDAWLAHLVDAISIPRQSGQCTRCRLADIPVLLLRLDPERVWLVADRPVAPYLSNWLSYSHEAAFSATR